MCENLSSEEGMGFRPENLSFDEIVICPPN